MEANSKNLKTSHYVWELIKYRPWLYFTLITIWIIKDIMPLIYGVFVKEFFDIIAGKPSLNIGMWTLMVLIIITALIQVLLIQLGFRLSVLHKFSISALLRRNILNSILKKPGAEAVETSTGEVINYFRDDVEQVEGSIGWLSWLSGQIIRAIFAAIILLRINAKITLLVILPLAAVIVLAQKSEKKIEKNREDSRQAAADVTGAVGEIFESVLAVKVSGSQKNIINNLKRLNEKRHHLTIKDSLLTQLIDSIYNNAVTLGTGLILLLSGQAIMAGSFTLGDFAIFIYYLAFISDSIESGGNFLVHFKQTGVAFKRMIKLIKSKDGSELVKHRSIYLKEKNLKKHNQCNGVKKNFDYESLDTLEVKGLSYSYDNSLNGIKDINFTLNRGEVTVIAGRTGSGKSTLLKTLLGLIPADSGEVYWNGEIVKNSKDFFVPPVCAYTAQVPNLFSHTVRDNILLGLSEEEVDLKRAVKSSVLEKDIEELEKGLDTVIGPKGVKLSGGQLQRVAAARMFVRNGQLLVFDDISSALDVETEKLLWTRLFKDNKPTCIIVSNRRSALEQAHNIILMKDGAIEAEGKLKDLLKDSREMQQIWG